jgi:nucleotide exchange factor SIL1
MSTGSACQSNPKTQIAALEVGSIPILIRLVSFDPSPEVRARALYAISGLVRNFPLAQKSLVDNGGLTAFHTVFQTDSADLTKLQLKIITLVSDLMNERLAVIAQIQMDGSSNNITAEKKKQYDAAGVEKVLVEQGFCLLIPRLLTYNESDEHDVVEKVLQAMISLSMHCQNQFDPVHNIIQNLEDRYHKLSISQETGEDYFTKLHAMCRQLLHIETQRDEL